MSERVEKMRSRSAPQVVAIKPIPFTMQNLLSRRRRIYSREVYRTPYWKKKKNRSEIRRECNELLTKELYRRTYLQVFDAILRIILTFIEIKSKRIKRSKFICFSTKILIKDSP